jgi:alkane 1-monooxygenase
MNAAVPALASHLRRATAATLSLPGHAARYLLSLFLPLATAAFLATRPHDGVTALPWILTVAALFLIDHRARPERRQPAEALPGWLFDALVVVLTLVQLLNVALLLGGAARLPLLSLDTALTVLLMGLNSGYSAITVAHELVHRPGRPLRNLGRLLLLTVHYEHFATEHVRGHHARVGTPEDPATARFGETFGRFYRRSLPAQLASAWRLEAGRVGARGALDPRLLGSRVLHGLLAELAIDVTILVLLGPATLLVFLAQAAIAVSLLEVVNYFEHWGLTRRGKRVQPVDSWDTESWFSFYTLVGLSRHADHHAHASRPFQSLRHFPESPKLPTGYYGCVLMVLGRNARFRALLTEELARRRLGPFAEPEQAGAAAVV